MGRGIQPASSCTFLTSAPRASAARAASTAPALCSAADSRPLAATSSWQQFTDGSATADSYDNNSKCSWAVAAPAGHRVELSFTRFSLQPCSGSGCVCDNDWVAVYDGTSVLAPARAVSCGSSLPVAQTSSGTTLFIAFRTDSSVVSTGFTASYRIGPSRALQCRHPRGDLLPC